MYKSDIKVHYKMYKVGKNWIFSAITIIGISSGITFLSTSNNVQADNSVPIAQQTESVKPATQDTNEATEKTQSVPVTKQTESVKPATQDANEATEKTQSVPVTKQTESAKPATQDTNEATEKTQSVPVTKQTESAKPATQDTNEATEKTQSVPVTKQTELAKPATQDTNEATEKTQSVPVTKQTELAKPATQDSNKKFQDELTQNSSLIQTDKSALNNINQTVEKNQGVKETTNLKIDNQKVNNPNIKVIDGKTYYYGEDGKPKKNYTVISDGKVLYFDNDTGALQSSANKFHDGLVTISDEHNAAYNLTPDNFTNVNGYLTASSWYRPKDILENGVNWVPSTDNDFRPLLMTWWPDVNTRISYLNYMKNINLLSQDDDFSDNNNQEALTNASMLAQVNIEKRIWQQHDINWLKDDVEKFIDSQSIWNINSESKGNDHLQGGALKYVNSDLTPDANSNYRLLNRTPTNQDGKVQDSSKQGGYEFLLANDVDNSNPVVQAEQLNWLHYMMNIGTINDNDSNANFDGYRIDAVDNVDADLLQIAGDYAKSAYGTNKNDRNANSHLSILEDWTNYDAQYVKEHGNNQLTMDFPDHLALKYSLNMPNSQRSGLEPDMSTSLVNRTGENSTENTSQPNYSFIRAHDSEVQTVIAEIIKREINPNSDGLTVTPEEIKQAFKIYNQDELQSDKKYTAYNIPASYSLLLTNKDTVPRVYYGDLYTDDGQYMEKQSPYYDSIVSLLKGRVKYVSGGQYMGIQYVNGDTTMPSNSYRGVLTSVRYGKDAMTSDSTGTDATRTQGLAVILSNNPDLRLNNSDSIVVNMGAAHKNQAYRPLLLTTKNGLKNYASDENAPIMYTNDLGQLIFKSNSVFGVSDPQVSGYVSVWVPVGAKEDQDARTQSNTDLSNDGHTYHSNAALDSQLIYEGFSNFQSMPVNTSDYSNVKISQNVDLFKNLGITSFELAPQYRSSTDSSFLDSVVKNGYAFTDRYDIGYDSPTKYGTVDQLLDCLRALHGKGIQAINDWVPDQIYNLPGEEIVTAQRTNSSGILNQNSEINNTLYDSRTIGGGKYQDIYGGAFLDQLKKLYPELFKVNQISTGQPMNPNERIREWSAKYFNGSNIQGRGAWYVLKDWATNKYFSVSSDSLFLPKQYLGEKVSSGFTSENGKTTYYSDSGYQARNTFIQDGSYWYYFDNNGYMATGFQTINDNHYFFLPNGIELRDGYLSDNSSEYYYDKNGKQISNQYYRFDNGDWGYFFKDGKMAKGKQEIDGKNQYFNQDGIQVKGNIVKNTDGTINYYEDIYGQMLTNKFGELPDGSWVYLDNNGNAVKGNQNINGQQLYFNQDGIQVKGNTVKNTDGTINYYDANTGEMLKNKFGELPDGSWVYLDNNGYTIKGKYEINGQQLYFNQDGIQVKGNTVKNTDGTINYYDVNTGELVKSKWIKLPDGLWRYFNRKGNMV